jgi:hypothetical protein
MAFNFNDNTGLTLKSKIHDSLAGLSLVAFGPTLDRVLREEKPATDALVEAYLLLENAAKFSGGEIRYARELLLPVIQHSIAEQQIIAQRELAASNDRLGTKVLFATWIGVAVAIAGVAVAIIAAIKG